MADPRRHTEFFGPDLGRGPFSASSPAVAAVQIATAVAQLRTPLSRADADVLAHGEFIRALADRLFPDFAAQIRIDVGPESADAIECTIRDDSGVNSLLHVWLADAKGGGETATAPGGVTWSGAAVLETVTALKRYLVVTPTNGVATLNISYTGDRTWYLAVSRQGRVFFSSAINFD
ncbi:MAG: hypothetical protein HZB38_02850 [Planctomycetes bacterium]|nr:hypothetical protein [Planctomycetota bacterium]